MKKLLFAAAIIAVAFLSSCAGAAGDPKAVLGNFFEALSKKDMATARKLATDDSKAMLDLMAVSYTHLDVYKRQVPGKVWR